MTILGSLRSIALSLSLACAGLGCASESSYLLPNAPYALPDFPGEAARIDGIVCSLPIEGRRTSLAEAMRRFRVPGVSAAAMVDGRIVWARGFGSADPARNLPMRPETVLQAASISKAVTAVGVMRLVEKGELWLDADVRELVDDWEPSLGGRPARITLRQLLSHSAGLNVHGFRGYATTDPERIPSTLSVLLGKGNSPAVRLEAPPGTRTTYSGGGFTVVQAAIEEELDLSFATVMRRYLLGPFGMKRSTFEQPLSPDNARFAGPGFDAQGRMVEGGWHTYPEQAAAGLWTTPVDLLTLASGLIRGFHGLPAPLSRAAVSAMLTPQSTDGAFGLGWVVKPRGQVIEAMHNGGNAGYSTMLVWRTDGFGAVAMANGEGPVAAALVDAIAEAYGWRKLQAKGNGCRR